MRTNEKRILDEFFEGANEVVRTALREGKIAELAGRVGKYTRSFRLGSRLSQSMQETIHEGEGAEWMARHTIARASEIGAKRIEHTFQRELLRTIMRILKEEPDPDINKLMQKVEGRLRRYYQTYEETMEIALARAGSLEQAIKNGAKYFRYTGPSVNIRPFCAQHLNRIYSIEEIEELNNGQNLSVLYFCGGWRCRHHWSPVVGKVEKEGKLFVHRSWSDLIEKYSGSKMKGEVKKLQNEYELAQRLADCPDVERVELNAERAERETRMLRRETGSGDIDLFVDGIPVQVKSTRTRSKWGLAKIANLARKQAGNIIIEYEDFEMKEIAINQLRYWLLRHSQKKVRIFLFNKEQKQLFEVKYE